MIRYINIFTIENVENSREQKIKREKTVRGG